eukprot:13400704-Alexandrium_andersonii.AAC.1
MASTTQAAYYTYLCYTLRVNPKKLKTDAPRQEGVRNVETRVSRKSLVLPETFADALRSVKAMKSVAGASSGGALDAAASSSFAAPGGTEMAEWSLA